MGGTYAGGSAAGPVFRRVGEMALRYLGVTPRGTVTMKLSEVSAQANKPTINSEKPASLPAAPTALLPAKAGEVRVPDLAGYPARDAIKAVVGLGLAPSIEGTGRLSRQEPTAGSVVTKGTAMKLVFEPST
jgi:cell division protein FtsI (penicillin-binding protein 3)